MYEFSEPQVTVGRNEGNHIVIQHGSMSGTHATFTLTADGSYSLADHGSTNHTFVNGEQIVETNLGAGAEILFGQVSAYFEHPELAAAAAPATPAASPTPSPGASFGGASPAVASTFNPGPLETGGRPANFQSVSHFPKNRKKKDPAGAAIMGMGFFALAVAVGLIGLSFVSL